jgi:hypothetical protein
MRTRLVLTAVAVSASAAAAVAVTPGTASSSTDPLGRHVAELRRAVSPYEDVSRALADGFVPSNQCVASPAGGMGFHYVNPDRVRRPVDPTKPAILVYAPGKDGSLQLGAAEFFVPDADQDVATDEDRPSLWGYPFDGPMPGHEPGMPVHYDLHVWTHVANPDGVFAAWNPRVHC